MSLALPFLLIYSVPFLFHIFIMFLQDLMAVLARVESHVFDQCCRF